MNGWSSPRDGGCQNLSVCGCAGHKDLYGTYAMEIDRKMEVRLWRKACKWATVEARKQAADIVLLKKILSIGHDMEKSYGAMEKKKFDTV